MISGVFTASLLFPHPTNCIVSFKIGSSTSIGELVDQLRQYFGLCLLIYIFLDEIRIFIDHFATDF